MVVLDEVKHADGTCEKACFLCQRERAAEKKKHAYSIFDIDGMREDIRAHKKHAYVPRSSGRRDIAMPGRATAKHMKARLARFMKAVQP